MERCDLYRVCAALNIVLFHFCEEGKNNAILWTITPAPGDDSVVVLHPSGEILYAALRTHVIPGNNIYTREGENKFIQWTINPAPGKVIVRVYHPLDEVLYLAYGNSVLQGSGSNAGRVTNTSNTDTNTGHIEFTLNDVRVTDAGDYGTKYQLPGSNEVRPVGASVVVFVKPSKPALTLVTAPFEGQAMVLMCTASSNSKPDGQLTMKYKWYINNADLPTESRYVTTGSQLQVKNIQKSDKENTFTCKGYENTTLLSDDSNRYTPDVKYGPSVVHMSPDADLYDIYENDDIGTITCSADCNTPCIYQWTFKGANVGGQSNTLTLNNIQRGSAGSYRCTATNEHGARDSQAITITVKYGPGTATLSPSTASYTLVEVAHNRLGPITCSADCNPPCTYQWSRDGTVTISADAVLLLTSATRTDDGIYTCKASNLYGNMVSALIRVSVEYKPENIKLSPSNQSYVILEHKRLGPILCAATCKPACTYKWWHNNVVIHQGAVINISKINRVHSGNYACVASNKHNTITSTGIDLTVQYPPENTNLMTNLPNGIVKENDILSVSCSTNSEPNSTMTILLEGDGRLILHRSPSKLTVNYTKSAECLDTGKYFCDAKNEYGHFSSREISVNVLCSPRLKSNVKPENTVSIGDSENLNLSGTVVANPPPHMSWTFSRNGNNCPLPIQNVSGGLDIYMTSHHVSYSSRIVKGKTGAVDLGDYVMNASNVYGSVIIIYHVIAKRAPDRPYDFSVTCDTTEANIEWTSNFIGGVNQNFVININQSGHVYGTYTVADKGMNQRHELIVTNLEPDTKYSFVINARNSIGSSINPPIRRCVTNKPSCASLLQDQSTFKAGIAMINIGVFCLVLSIAVTFYNVRRMPAYTESDVTRSNVYEDLGEKDKPSVYDRLQAKRKTADTDYMNTKIN